MRKSARWLLAVLLLLAVSPAGTGRVGAAATSQDANPWLDQVLTADDFDADYFLVLDALGSDFGMPLRYVTFLRADPLGPGAYLVGNLIAGDGSPIPPGRLDDFLKVLASEMQSDLSETEGPLLGDESRWLSGIAWDEDGASIVSELAFLACRIDNAITILVIGVEPGSETEPELLKYGELLVGRL
jgi:hypothetical protein